MSGSQLLLLGGTPQQVVSDPNFEYTTLLLPGNGTNGAQNNTFLDSSTNNFTITRNGNTTQGTFSPFSQTGWGNFFDGTGDYLSLPSNSAFAFGTGAYTIEAWVYLTAYAATQGSIFDSGNANGALDFFVTSTGAIGIGEYGVGNIFGSSAAAVSLNAWNHVAVVRSSTGSNDTKIYVNGTSTATGTNSKNWTVTTTPSVGGINIAGYNTIGYLSNVRVVKGIAVYTANFTPSTTPLINITNTSLLTCQSNRFIDNSTNAFAITRNGDVSVQAFSPFNPTAAWSASTNGGSGYFDGSGDSITAGTNAAFQFGTGNFTVEGWVYPSATAIQCFFDNRTSDASSGGFFFGTFSSNQLAIYTAATATSGGTVPLNTWSHVAVVRNGSTWTLYLNGTSVATYSSSANLTNGNSQIGASTSVSGSSSNFFTGYMSNVRVVKGTAVYTANFTPPTAPLTAITNTSLLTNYTNAGIYDATSKNDLETVGNAQISTTQSKFGGSSMYFDGTGDYASIPATQNLVFGTGDFTIEMWLYSGAQSGTGARMMGNGAGGSWASGKYILTTTTAANPNKFTFGVNNASPADLLVSTTTFNDSTWRHVAVTRYGNVFRLFVNGIQESTTTTSISVDNGTAAQIRIGSSGIPGDADWAGYINDLRITKGVARYTANFTAPTAAFPLL